MRTTMGIGLLLTALAAGCDAGPVIPSGSEAAVDATPAPATPGSTADDLSLLLGPWRPAPLPVSDAMRDAFATACAESAAESGLDAGDLPPAVVDARGQGVVRIILADDRAAAICEARIQPGPDFRFDRPAARLAPGSAGPVAEDEIDIVGYTVDDSGGGEGPRTVLYGRVGRQGFEVRIGFDDESEVVASKGGDWYVAWWPGAVRPATVAAVDRRSVAVMGVDPGDYVEGRAGPASWWVDPAGAALTPRSTVVQALVLEQACASGQSAEGRILEPEMFASDDAFLISFWVRHRIGGQDRQGHPPARFDIQLPQPLGDRQLLDGSEVPPRDATVPAE